ncbi:hypothetical protein [Caudoviricetes sp.]|nr:hypothetical protein [Caudoviricetes sp.]
MCRAFGRFLALRNSKLLQSPYTRSARAFSRLYAPFSPSTLISYTFFKKRVLLLRLYISDCFQ